MLTLQALICATAHLIFFRYLDGRILTSDISIFAKKTMIPQGYATTISLLLIAAFRAMLFGSIGLCYTQYLWATLRNRVLKVRFFKLPLAMSLLIEHRLGSLKTSFKYRTTHFTSQVLAYISPLLYWPLLLYSVGSCPLPQYIPREL
jgi:hypothetical protein